MEWWKEQDVGLMRQRSEDLAAQQFKSRTCCQVEWFESYRHLPFMLLSFSIHFSCCQFLFFSGFCHVVCVTFIRFKVFWNTCKLFFCNYLLSFHVSRCHVNFCGFWSFVFWNCFYYLCLYFVNFLIFRLFQGTGLSRGVRTSPVGGWGDDRTGVGSVPLPQPYGGGAYPPTGQPQTPWNPQEWGIFESQTETVPSRTKKSSIVQLNVGWNWYFWDSIIIFPFWWLSYNKHFISLDFGLTPTSTSLSLPPSPPPPSPPLCSFFCCCWEALLRSRRFHHHNHLFPLLVAVL